MNQALQKESLNWSELKQVEKRLSAIENRLNPKERPCAWLVFVAPDETVTASHIWHGSHKFENIEDFEAFRITKGYQREGSFSVIIVNSADCKGEEPKEL